MEKSGLSSKEEIKRINEDVYARLMTVVELTVNESGRKRSSPSIGESSIEKKSMISSIAHGEKTEIAEFESLKPATSKEAKTLAEKIAQHRALSCPRCIGLEIK
ncbi:hypothetical protein D8674_026422 [Pyrus ussuriensis x Pyrus communis]|uniref:Uncharacterized protein n=1 Tax=Pyrus ussuriensis x Pyrus communis TaxID=2448454 RepID=A0A5N5I7W3_9ROSA|nr:hypothetical protein D8674_026422 [Pyrus ussuriensis x Pyrus communis]